MPRLPRLAPKAPVKQASAVRDDQLVGVGVREGPREALVLPLFLRNKDYSNNEDNDILFG